MPTVQRFSRRERSAVLGAVVADGFSTGVFGSLTSVLLAQRFGLTTAGAVVAAGSLGRFPALLLVRWADERGERRLFGVSAFGLLVTLLSASSLAAVALAAAGPIWGSVVSAALFVSFNNATTALVNQRGIRQIVRLGPGGMVGQSAGMFYGSFVLISAAWLPLLATLALAFAGLAVQQAQVFLLNFGGQGSAEAISVRWRELLHPAGGGILLGFLTYGPLLLAPALAVEIASVSWVGPSMAAYAAGALLAPRLDRRLKLGDTPPVLFLLAGIGIGTWMFAWSGPLLLAARVVAGASLFVAQGRFLRSVSRERSGSLHIAAASMGLGVGGAGGSWLTGLLVGQTSVWFSSAIFASAAWIVAGYFLARGRQSTKSGVSHP